MRSLAIPTTLALLALGLFAASPAAGATTAQGPPVNLGPPQIQGVPPSEESTVTAGETLVALNGKWEGEPSTFSYQWLHCRIVGARGGPIECSPIPGATSPTYSLTGSDLYWFVKVEVTAANAAGKTSAQSPKNAFVVAPVAALKSHPRKKTTSTHTRFAFTANAANATFECKLDQAPFKRCRSPFQASLQPGHHVFRVRAVGPGEARQNAASITAFRWQISRTVPARG